MTSAKDEASRRDAPPSVERLRAQVHAAWSGATSPTPPLVDCPCPECTELEERLRGRDWRSVDSSLADGLEQDLPLMGARTFRALLPAFLLAALDAESEVGEFLGDSLEPGEFNTPRFEGLSNAQGAAVLAFLRFDPEDDEDPGGADGPQRSIREYWQRFDGAQTR